jgi:DNA modification methylase
MSEKQTQIKVPDAFRPLLTDIRTLKQDGDNPNEMTKKQQEALWRSLLKFGWFKPILADKDGLLGDGAQRIEVCLTHQEYYAPVLQLDVDDPDRRLLRQVANKLRGTHDQLRDALEYKRIDEAGKRQDLLKVLQLSERDIKEALEAKLPPEEEYQAPPLNEIVTNIQQGDIFELGDHRLMCGDSCKQEDVNKLIGEEKIDNLSTDPPYGVYDDWEDSLRGRTQTQNSSTYNDHIPDYLKFSTAWVTAVKPHLADYNSHYVWINGAHILELLQALTEAGSHTRTDIIWMKSHFVLSRLDYLAAHETCLYGWFGKHKWYGGSKERTVWQYPKPAVNKEHPTMKPVEIMVRGILNSTMPGMNVCDLFGGSGTTLIACEQVGRRCFMMELEPKYCQIIIDRWQAYTGEQAHKI